MRAAEGPVRIRSFADEDVLRPRFGIRSGGMAAGNRLSHRHDDFEVLFLASEASARRIGLHERAIRHGRIFFIAPMTPHQMRFDADAACDQLLTAAARRPLDWSSPGAPANPAAHRRHDSR
ncbi:MAG: hypothetical protein M5U08_13495 [Burkholderiales bacterium]|nr:hypothetical protein [Burkholderiales bacterium]